MQTFAEVQAASSAAYRTLGDLEWEVESTTVTHSRIQCGLVGYFTSPGIREVKCGHVTRWTNLLMTTCCDTFRYLNYSLYNFEIKLPKREQQMLNACFEPVVIVFCCVIIRTTSNVCEVFVDTRPSPPRPRISDSGRLNSVV